MLKNLITKLRQLFDRPSASGRTAKMDRLSEQARQDSEAYNARGGM